MTEIIPAIIAKNNSELNAKIALVKKHAKRVQLDIMDGKFVKNKTIMPKAIKLYHKIDTEFHLMVYNPEKYLDDCARIKPQKIIFHFGTTKNPFLVIKKIKRHKIKAGLALNPEVKVSAAKEAIKKADFVQLMTVHPGKYGAKFLPSVLRKIAQIKKIRKIPVEVDGGINKDTVCLAIKHHADVEGVGSAIFKARNAEQSIKEIKKFASSC